MKKNILAENEALRLNLGWFLLFCIALPQPINLGIEDFLALPADANTYLVQIFATVQDIKFFVVYIVAILLAIFVPRYIVQLGRILIIIGIFAELTMLLPLSSNLLFVVYLLQSLTDVFILALKPIIIISLFTKETAIKAVILIYTIRPIVEVILEKSGISLSFIGFNAYIVVVSLCYLYFFCHLPKKVWPRYVYKGDELVPPRMLLVGICILLLLSTVIVLFSETVVQSVPSGHTVLDLSVVLSFVVLYVLWKRIGINPFRSGSVLVSLGVLGFLGVVLSSYIPASIIPAIVLISAGKVIQGINASYSGIILMERYPSRFTLPIIMISAIVALVTHYLIYYALKDNMQFLYLIYLLVTVVLAMLYFVLSPYLIHFMRSNIGTKRVEVKGSQPITPSNDTLSILTEYAFDKLARYEIEIAELIMQGYSNPEMAKIMRITENTVKSYRKNLYSKLQIHSRRELFELIERGGR